MHLATETSPTTLKAQMLLNPKIFTPTSSQTQDLRCYEGFYNYQDIAPFAYSLFCINRILYGEYSSVFLFIRLSVFYKIYVLEFVSTVYMRAIVTNLVLFGTAIYMSISVNMHLVFQIRNKGSFYIYLVLFIIFSTIMQMIKLHTRIN